MLLKPSKAFDSADKSQLSVSSMLILRGYRVENIAQERKKKQTKKHFLIGNRISSCTY